MRFAALEEGSPQAGFAGLRRDTGLQEAGALGALVLDCRRRPADELAVVFGGPVAAVRVRWLRGRPHVGDPAQIRRGAARRGPAARSRTRSPLSGPSVP